MAGMALPLGPNRILDKATLDRMHEAALEMLAKTGMLVEHEEVKAEIAKRKGFTLAEGRVRIAPEKVEALVKEFRSRAGPEPAREPDARLTLGTDTRASFIVEKDGRTLRPMTKQDVVDSAKLIAMLKDRGVGGSTAGIPMDVPVPLRPLEQYLIAAEFSPEGGVSNDVNDAFTAGVIREMDKVYGRGFSRSVWSLSPLVLGGPELDVLWHYRDEIEGFYCGSMPSMGMSGPCDPIGLFTVGAAECLGGAVILRELLPGRWAAIGPHPEPADMATGAMVFGTPEWEILDLMHRDVHGYYGMDWRNKMIHTTSSVPGVQAAADHGGSVMLGMLYGYTHFGPGGMLALDEVYSPAQLVIDVEILEHTERVMKGAWSGEGLDPKDLPQVVDEVIKEGGLFAGHETTAVNMRKQYYRSKALPRMNRAQWQTAGAPEEAGQAQAEADRLIASFDYRAPADILKELRAICEAAKKKLGF